MKTIFKSALVLVLVISMCIPAFATTNTDEIIFSDIDSTHYAYNAIKTMKTYGIINGYPDGTFRPNNTVTRVEFATMMVKALKLQINLNATSSFSDMNTETWAIPYVEAAKNFLTGYTTATGYTFKPHQASVREDMAVALIKALGKNTDTETVLSLYADQNGISNNLRAFVAAAINNNLMIGETIGTQRYFYPQRSLTRAEAASLLMNVIREEKIIFNGEEKVTFDVNGNTDTDSDSNTPYGATTLSAELDRAGNNGNGNAYGNSNANSAVVLKWQKITHPDFEGYKVVASLTDQTPVYPENGYALWITDKNKTTALIKAGSSYNGSEFSKFEAGKTYYFSITAVYKDKKVPGNVITVTIPNSPSTSNNTNYQDNALTLQAENKGDSIELKWTIAQADCFQGYKVVASQTDTTPMYPDNGYFKYITDRDDNSITINKDDSYGNGDFTKFEKGKTYYIAITYLCEGYKKTSNVVKIDF
ncbi:S-layer homology domain-containing protein [Fusibacter ferrireducens]|uniref:S-layer homology domain-containing protein n=1 Tax=Fusibacter ferrireducens TaxID=2785058 RepID=A0ABR9ZSR2_9FIRM|nr:S-layer homology domain-containing protein [Fusibacter ferrireducens]MBF4693505.1 S-layer homology domain-containing protein [Fusibacter ferrireducens]